jgi:hypothetical protein
MRVQTVVDGLICVRDECAMCSSAHTASLFALFTFIQSCARRAQAPIQPVVLNDVTLTGCSSLADITEDNVVAAQQPKIITTMPAVQNGGDVKVEVLTTDESPVEVYITLLLSVNTKIIHKFVQTPTESKEPMDTSELVKPVLTTVDSMSLITAASPKQTPVATPGSPLQPRSIAAPDTPQTPASALTPAQLPSIGNVKINDNTLLYNMYRHTWYNRQR